MYMANCLYFYGVEPYPSSFKHQSKCYCNQCQGDLKNATSILYIFHILKYAIFIASRMQNGFEIPADICKRVSEEIFALDDAL